MKYMDLRTHHLLKNINHLHTLHTCAIHQMNHALCSLQDDLLFNPILLSIDVTSTTVLKYLEKKKH